MKTLIIPTPQVIALYKLVRVVSNKNNRIIHYYPIREMILSFQGRHPNVPTGFLWDLLEDFSKNKWLNP